MYGGFKLGKFSRKLLFQNISTTNHEPSVRNALDPWNTPMMKNEGGASETEVKSGASTVGNTGETQSKNENPYNYPREKFMKKSQKSWYGRDYMNSIRNSNFNLYTMSQSDPTRIANLLTVEKFEEENKLPRYVQDEKFNARKMLSWQEQTNSSVIRQNKLNAIQESQVMPHKKNNRIKTSENSRYNNVMNEINDYQRDGEAEEYEEVYYVDSSPKQPITNADFVTTTETVEIKKPVTSTSHPTETKINYTINNKFNTEKMKIEETNGSDITIHSTPTYSLSDLVFHKNNNLFVHNASFPSAEWKRRKREAPQEAQSEDQQTRRKRSWFWPSLSFLRNNAPQMEEDDDFDQNESPINQDSQGSKRSSDKSSFSFEDDTDGNEEFDDFVNDPSGYDREKRDTGSRSYYSGDKSSYYYNNKDGRNSYLPVSRNRRYVQSEFREPQQQLLTEISDAELFGALPQGYAGELTRYKRVKRTDIRADKT